jgi:Flp pilus assembly protein TadD
MIQRGSRGNSSWRNWVVTATVAVAATLGINVLWRVGRDFNDPAQAGKLSARGHQNYMRGDYVHALPLFERAVRLKPSDIVAQRGLVWTKLKLGEPEDAVRDADAALTRFPDDCELVEVRADALVSLGRLPEAVQGYARCIELDPSGYWEPWMKLAAAYEQLGRTEDARATYQDLLSRYPGHEGAKKRLRALGR